MRAKVNAQMISMRANLNVAINGGCPLNDGEPETCVTGAWFRMEGRSFYCLYYAKLAICEIRVHTGEDSTNYMTVALDRPSILKDWFEEELINWAILNNINVVQMLSAFRGAWNEELST